MSRLKIMRILTHAVMSLAQHKLRSALSILSVVCGIGIILAMLSIGAGAKHEILSQLEALGMRNIYVKAKPVAESQIDGRGRTADSHSLSIYDVNRLKGYAAINDIAALKEVQASLTVEERKATPQILACTPALPQIQKITVVQGRFILEDDLRQKIRVCVLGAKVAEELGPFGRVGNHVRIQDSVFKIVGVIAGSGGGKASGVAAIAARDYNDAVFIPLGSESAIDGQGMITDSEFRVTELILQLKSVGQVLGGLDVIKRTLEISHGGMEDYQVVAPQELLLQSQRAQRTFNYALGSLGVISLIVGGIGIMNIMLATVTERTREIGVRRAIGATREHIIIQFIAEALMLTLAGGLIGIAAGSGVTWLVANIAGWKAIITFSSVALSIVMSIFVGIFSGLYPAYMAAKMDPIAALRHE